MSLTKKVRAVCRRRKIAGHGVCCAFIKLNEQSGVKLYTNKRNARLTHGLHSKAAAMELAPPIQSGIFAVRCNPYPPGHFKNIGETRTYYGYLVGLVTLANEGLVVGSTEYNRQLYQLVDALNDEGFGVEDMGSNNWGHYRGRPVCIDFSHFSDIYDELDY